MVKYCLHESMPAGYRTLVLNHFDARTHAVTVKSLGDGCAADVHRPFAAPERITLPCDIEVAAQEFVVVTEATP
jgi:hypothetical protein